MTAIPPISSAALQIMQQFQSPSPSADDKPLVGEDLVATAHGRSLVASDAEARVSESVFSVNHLDPTQMKIELMERVGKKFGIEMDDFDDQASYGRAIQREIEQIRQQPGGDLALADIEKELGLDKLGLSIDTLINAIIEPGSADGDKLDAALEKQIVEDAREGFDEDDSLPGRPVAFNDLGIYGRSA